MPHLAPPIVMTLAASDPTSGAGMQADLLTIASMGCHPVSAVTGLRVRDTSGLRDVYPLDADWVDEQARAVLEDMPVAAFKVGLLPSIDVVNVIAEIAADYPDVPLVLDLDLTGSRGDALSAERTTEAIKSLLLPLTTLLVTNGGQLQRLAGADDARHGDVLALAAGRLLAMGCGYVLATGAHENTPEVINTLFDGTGRSHTGKWQRLPGSFHGAGSTLSSAVASLLAQGMAVPEAVSEAQAFTWESLSAAFHAGMGKAIPDRFFWAGSEDENSDE
jgi:hydroxymethylpyrimidine/phosphomethylpyrimidine kinase